MTVGGETGPVFCPALAFAANPTSSATQMDACAIIFMIPRLSATDVGPDVDVIGHPLQKVCGLECTEDQIHARRVEIPQSLPLPLGQMQPRHFGVLGFDQLNPVTDILDHGLLHSTSNRRRGKCRTTRECGETCPGCAEPHSTRRWACELFRGLAEDPAPGDKAPAPARRGTWSHAASVPFVTAEVQSRGATFRASGQDPTLV